MGVTFLSGCVEDILWGGVDQSLTTSVQVEARLVDRHQFFSLAKQGFEGSTASAGTPMMKAYLVLKIRNTDRRAAWGMLRVQTREDNSVDIPILHLEPEQPEAAIYVVYVSSVDGNKDYPKYKWIKLRGK
jgi:hypothetical protein